MAFLHGVQILGMSQIQHKSLDLCQVFWLEIILELILSHPHKGVFLQWQIAASREHSFEEKHLGSYSVLGPDAFGETVFVKSTRGIAKEGCIQLCAWVQKQTKALIIAFLNTSSPQKSSFILAQFTQLSDRHKSVRL